MIRVLVAVENPLLCAAFAALLDREVDLAVVARARKRDEAVAVAGRADPEVAVIDLDLAGGGELSSAVGLCRRGVRSLVLADPCDHVVLSRAARAKVHGIGFVTTRVPGDRLVGAVRDLARGEPVIDPELAAAALTAEVCPLTHREHEVLALAGGGLAANEIAKKLGLCVGTVHNHLSRINDKLGSHTRFEAVRLARDAGWL